MADLDVQCPCGSTTLTLSGEPVMQGYCHCDDCQAASGAAYVPRAVYPGAAIRVKAGETRAWTYRTNPRINCAKCGVLLFIEAKGFPFKAINAELLKEKFWPRFHQQCRYAVAPVVDILPHYKDTPKEFGGSGEPVGW
jgi:hypothetical protein